MFTIWAGKIISSISQTFFQTQTCNVQIQPGIILNFTSFVKSICCGAVSEFGVRGQVRALEQRDM
jgi:hypothetical protein